MTAGGPSHLAENIVHFARTLRSAGMKVGPGRVHHALDAVALVGWPRATTSTGPCTRRWWAARRSAPCSTRRSSGSGGRRTWSRCPTSPATAVRRPPAATAPARGASRTRWRRATARPGARWSARCGRRSWPGRQRVAPDARLRAALGRGAARGRGRGLRAAPPDPGAAHPPPPTRPARPPARSARHPARRPAHRWAAPSRCAGAHPAPGRPRWWRSATCPGR